MSLLLFSHASVSYGFIPTLFDLEVPSQRNLFLKLSWPWSLTLLSSPPWSLSLRMVESSALFLLFHWLSIVSFTFFFSPQYILSHFYTLDSCIQFLYLSPPYKCLFKKLYHIMKVIVKKLENIGKQKENKPRNHLSFDILAYNF